jgi:phage terminase Nu1 subunit (DNA packaging protein)
MKRGFFVGFGLTVWRILRCNPFCAGGHDPVPERKRRKYKKIPKYDTDRVGNDISSQAEEKDELAARNNDSTANK